MDTEKLCRLCATEGKSLFPIFSGSVMFDDIEPFIKIQTCAPVQISQHDGLPTMMCSGCKDKLNEAYNFRLQIIAAYEKLNCLQKECSKIDVDWDCDSHDSNCLMFSDVKSETNSCQGIEENSTELKQQICNENQEIIKHRQSELCPFCGKLFTKNSFSDHMQNVHNSKAAFECDICGMKTKTKRALWHHKKFKHDKTNVECIQCRKTFSNSAGLRIHINNIHLGIKKHNCTLCDKSFSKKPYLTTHMRSHTGERPFQCPFCSFAFTGRWNLKQHVRLHTKEKPYKCNICNEAFYQNVVLKSHIRKKHADI